MLYRPCVRKESDTTECDFLFQDPPCPFKAGDEWFWSLGALGLSVTHAEKTKSLGKAGFHCTDHLELRIGTHRWVILPMVDTQGEFPRPGWWGGVGGSVASPSHSSRSLTHGCFSQGVSSSRMPLGVGYLAPSSPGSSKQLGERSWR